MVYSQVKVVEDFDMDELHQGAGVLMDWGDVKSKKGMEKQDEIT